MKKLMVLVLGMLFTFVGVALPAVEMNVNAVGMKKQLSGEWEPVDTQDEFGVIADLRGLEWPVSLEFGYLFSTQEGQADDIFETEDADTLLSNLDATTQELSVGVKKIWPIEEIYNFFISGGAAWIRGQLDVTDADSLDEANLGWYASTGFYFSLLKFLNIGILARYSDTRLTLGGADVNAGGFHYGVLAGINF